MLAHATFLLWLGLSVWYPMVPMQDPNFREESKELNNEDRNVASGARPVHTAAAQDHRRAASRVDPSQLRSVCWTDDWAYVSVSLDMSPHSPRNTTWRIDENARL